jgi:hypothetical protein
MLFNKVILNKLLREFAVSLSLPVCISSFSMIMQDLKVIDELPWYLDYISLVIGIVIFSVYERGGLTRGSALFLIFNALLSILIGAIYFGLDWVHLEPYILVTYIFVCSFLVLGFIYVYKKRIESVGDT